MKNKRPLIYLGIAIAIAIVILTIERPEESRVNDVAEKYFIADYDSADVVRIEVEQLLDGLELTRDANGWRVAPFVTKLKEELLVRAEPQEGKPESYRANRARVNSALGSFGALEEGVLVSTNPEKQNLYRVSAAAGAKVRGFDKEGKTVFDVVIGKNGPDFASSYVRRADENEVYLVRRSLMGVFSPRVEDWRERRLWTIPSEEITGITVEVPEDGYELTRDKEGRWKVTGHEDEAIDEERTEQLVKLMASVQGAGFVDAVDASEMGLAPPGMTLIVTHGKDDSVTLDIGDADASGKRYARFRDGEVIYLLPPAFVDAIQLDPPLK